MCGTARYKHPSGDGEMLGMVQVVTTRGSQRDLTVQPVGERDEDGHLLYRSSLTCVGVVVCCRRRHRRSRSRHCVVVVDDDDEKEEEDDGDDDDDDDDE